MTGSPVLATKAPLGCGRPGRPPAPGLRLRVVGIGSPFGDDRVGWQVVEALRDLAHESGVEAALCADPASELLGLLRGAESVIVVDGIRSGATPGTLVRCMRADLNAGPGALSGHGVSIPQLLDLAETLGELPAEIEFFGIEIDSAHLCAGSLSPAVEAAIPRLVTMILKAAQPKLRRGRRPLHEPEGDGA